MVFTVSCEINLPTISDSGTIPYQRPDTPANIKVLSGNKDKIVITWDPVENASYYVIEGAVSSDFGERFSVFGNTTATRFEINRSSEIRTDKSYLFTIRAVTKFGNGQTFASLNSEYVEGALAPESKDIQFYSVVTDDTVSAYWNIPTFFSTLHGDELLYEAAFTLEYKLKDDAEWTAVKGADVNPSPDKPWMFHQIDINSSNLKQNEDYLFRIGVEVTDDESGEKSVIYSDPLTLMLHSDKLPSAISDVTIKNGESIYSIDLKWTVPDWTLPLTDENCYFKIERAVNGSDDWGEKPLVNEISTGKQDSRLVRTLDESTGVVTVEFKDVLSEDNQIADNEYVYRITNAASSSDVMYVQEAPLAVSAPGSLFRLNVTSATGSWTMTDNLNASVEFAYEANVEDARIAEFGLTPYISSMCYSPERGEWFDGNAYSVMDSKNVTEIFGAEGTYKIYKYYFELRDESGNTYGSKVPVEMSSTDNTFQSIAGVEGEYPILGRVFPSTVDFVRNVEASDNRNNKVVVSFDEIRYEEGRYTDAYIYSYSINGGAEYINIEPTTVKVNDDGTTRKEFSIDRSDLSSVDVLLKVECGYYIHSPAAVSGMVLQIPAGFELQASTADGRNIDLSWATGDVVVEGVVYQAMYRKIGTSSWNGSDVVTFASGSHTVDMGAVAAGDYEFRFALKNATFAGEGTVYTEPAAVKLMSAATEITATKGDFADKVVISWTPADSSAAGYKVYRYNDVIGARDLVGTVEAGVTSYEYAGATGEYLYLVLDADGNGSVAYTPELKPDYLGDSEPVNMGYVFGSESLNPVSTSHLDADNHLKLYFTVEFDAKKYISTYEVSATAEDVKYTINPSTFEVVGEIRTNGKSADEVGYAAYDPSTGKIIVNVAFNLVDDDLKVMEVGVTGSTGGNETSKYNSVGEARRALNALNYSELFSVSLKREIAAANKKFGGDWWTGSPWIYDDRSDVYIEGCKKASESQGHIKFINYIDKTYHVKFNTTSEIHVHSLDNGWGYMGGNPLHTIGFNSPNNNTDVTITATHTVGGIPVVYDVAHIRVDGITKNGASGKFIVKIGDSTKTEDVMANNPLLKVKPF